MGNGDRSFYHDRRDLRMIPRTGHGDESEVENAVLDRDRKGLFVRGRKTYRLRERGVVDQGRISLRANMK